MLKVVASQKVMEDKVEQFVELAKELVVASKAEERNIDYSLNRKVDDPNVYCFIEVWEDKDALDAHMASEHFQRIAPRLGTCVEEGTTQMGVYATF